MTIRHIKATNTPYAYIINTLNSEWYNFDTSSFETFDAGNLADYAVPAGTQFGTTGVFPWTFPGSIAAGQYSVFVHDGDDDSVIEAGVVDWDGAQLITASNVRKITFEIESGVTAMNALKAIAAVLAGQISTAGEATEIFGAVGNPSTARVEITVDEDGNRTAVVIN